MAVVARGKHYYLLQTELRVEKLAAPDWSYNADAADWNAFVPELEALYDRIEFLKARNQESTRRCRQCP